MAKILTKNISTSNKSAQATSAPEVTVAPAPEVAEVAAPATAGPKRKAQAAELANPLVGTFRRLNRANLFIIKAKGSTAWPAEVEAAFTALISASAGVRDAVADLKATGWVAPVKARATKSPAGKVEFKAGDKVVLKGKANDELAKDIGTESAASLVCDRLLPSGKWALRATAGEAANQLVGWVKPNALMMSA